MVGTAADIEGADSWKECGEVPPDAPARVDALAFEMVKQRLARDGGEAPMIDAGLRAKARGVDEEFGGREGRGLREARLSEHV